MLFAKFVIATKKEPFPGTVVAGNWVWVLAQTESVNGAIIQIVDQWETVDPVTEVNVNAGASYKIIGVRADINGDELGERVTAEFSTEPEEVLIDVAGAIEVTLS